MIKKVGEYFLATRPWSFTAAIIPILITASLYKVSLFSTKLWSLLIMGVSMQSAANLTNTYFDYINGVDSKSHGEETLVQKKLSTNEVILLLLGSYTIALVSVLPYLLEPNSFGLRFLFVMGGFLGYFYTGQPLGLKYMALGDFVIFLCFGPILMQFAGIVLTGETNDDLYLYSIPIGLLTEEICHVNNARDIQADQSKGCVTLAIIMGAELSYLYFLFLLTMSYLSIGIISWYHHWGCFMTFLTLPLALSLNRNYVNGDLLHLTVKTAELHLPFGILMILGIIFTNKGFQSLLMI